MRRLQYKQEQAITQGIFVGVYSYRTTISGGVNGLRHTTSEGSTWKYDAALLQDQFTKFVVNNAIYDTSALEVANAFKYYIVHHFGV